MMNIKYDLIIKRLKKMKTQITLNDIKDEVSKEELLEIIGLALDAGVSIEEAIAEFIEANYEDLEEVA